MRSLAISALVLLLAPLFAGCIDSTPAGVGNVAPAASTVPEDSAAPESDSQVVEEEETEPEAAEEESSGQGRPGSSQQGKPGQGCSGQTVAVGSNSCSGGNSTR